MNFVKYFKNIFFTEHLRATASENIIDGIIYVELHLSPWLSISSN